MTESCSVDYIFSAEWVYFVVDDIFATYIRRQGRKQPLLTQYCDGKNVQCPGWMTQWGSKYLGDQGKTPYEILTNYYGSDLDLVKRLLLQAAHEQPSVLKDPEPRALFLNFGASTLDHELRVYVGQVADRNDTLDALNRRVNELFAENNIDIAFNQLDIFIKNKDTGEEIPFIDVAKLAQNH